MEDNWWTWKKALLVIAMWCVFIGAAILTTTIWPHSSSVEPEPETTYTELAVGIVFLVLLILVSYYSSRRQHYKELYEKLLQACKKHGIDTFSLTNPKYKRNIGHGRGINPKYYKKEAK